MLCSVRSACCAIFAFSNRMPSVQSLALTIRIHIGHYAWRSCIVSIFQIAKMSRWCCQSSLQQKASYFVLCGSLQQMGHSSVPECRSFWIKALCIPKRMTMCSCVNVSSTGNLTHDCSVTCGGHAGRELNSNQAWSCVDVYTALSRLADVGQLEGVTNILKGPLTACPELVLLGLAAATPGLDRRILQTRIAQPLALRFAAQAAQGSPASQALMHQLRDINGEPSPSSSSSPSPPPAMSSSSSSSSSRCGALAG